MGVARALSQHSKRIALVTQGQSFRYSDILNASRGVAATLSDSKVRSPPPRVDYPPNFATQPRIAVMAEPGIDYITGTIGTWMNRGIVVPLALSHPDSELGYVLQDCQASVVLTSRNYTERMRGIAQPLGIKVFDIESLSGHLYNATTTTTTTTQADADGGDGGALIVYTSGTTGRPKGALHTHKSINAQIRAMQNTWEWSSEDNILHTLPLHHIHGIVNALYCALASGATVDMTLTKFSPSQVWSRLCGSTHTEIQRPTIFMGVPTMYSYLLNTFHDATHQQQEAYASAAQSLRLAVSGSAACPLPTMSEWKKLSGTVPLERYGMTETGMLLTNPLHGTRIPGTVGQPFPGVHVKLDPSTGELGVKSDQLFAGYWGKPEATEKSFDSQGYFLTGDTAEIDHESHHFKLLGRTSVDIIKHGGYKISALDIESVLLAHPRIAECAVLGLPDHNYGEIIGVVAALKDGDGDDNKFALDDLVSWARDKLPPYQLPRLLSLVSSLPRNAMGKVNKKSLRQQVFPDMFPPPGPASGV